jgi:hypothetical protein
MDTIKIESLWYEGEYTMVYVIDWDFDVWVEYGTFKVKGGYTYAGILDMLVHGSDLLEYVE